MLNVEYLIEFYVYNIIRYKLLLIFDLYIIQWNKKSVFVL